MLERLGKRARYEFGNCVRLVTRPWMQWAVEPEEVTSLFGCGFGHDHWHHLRQTLREYDADALTTAEGTAMWRFLKEFTPNSISELVDGSTSLPLPLFVFPWGTFIKDEVHSPKDAWQSRFCGPSSDDFIREEYKRTISLYQDIRANGYMPTRYPNSFVGGTWLEALDGERRFVVLQGNHRMAILAHLGYQQIPVRYLPGRLRSVREADLSSWPLVASGRCTAAHARDVFRLYFRETGWAVARRLGIETRLS